MRPPPRTRRREQASWSPGTSEDLLDIGRPHSSARPGASVRPSRRRPAVKVVVFQCPLLASFELTSRRGSRSGWLSSSGRSCSAACAVGDRRTATPCRSRPTALFQQRLARRPASPPPWPARTRPRPRSVWTAGHRAGAARPAPHINPTDGARHAHAEPCRRTTT